MWWWRLIIFAEFARSRRILFQLSLENPCSDYFQIFAVCILAPGNLPGIFLACFSFFNKIQDGRQNPMALSRAWTASWICFMFGLKEIPHPGRVLKSFWCDSDNKKSWFFFIFPARLATPDGLAVSRLAAGKMIFLCVFILAEFCSFWPSTKFGNIAIHPYSDYF